LLDVPASEFTRASMRHALANRLGLRRLGLGSHGLASPVTGLRSVEFEWSVRPPIAVAIAHWGELCRAALVIMPRDSQTEPLTFSMAGDDMVHAAEKQLRYVSLLGSGPTPTQPCVRSIHYRVESWSHDRCATISFSSPSRGPLRTLATTLHQLVDHVVRGTGALPQSEDCLE
jgi:hypothetical protein